MSEIIKLILIVVFVVSSSNMASQEIELREFRPISDRFLYSDHIFSNLASECAIICLKSNKKVVVEPNMGIKKRETDNTGLVFLYVPAGTTNVSVSYKDYSSLYYVFPEALKANQLYNMRIRVSKNSNESPISQQQSVKSADIELLDFRHNPQNLIARMTPEYDQQGLACAVIRYTVNDDNFVVEPNLGVVKTIKRPGEILQYVPRGTKRISVRNGNYMPLRDYVIPIEIESKRTYDVAISLTGEAIRRKKASPEHDNYLGIGYNNPSMLFNSEGGTRRLTIHCNSSWDISAPSWCKLSKTVGTGVMEIEVIAKTNTTGKMRHGVIGIQSQDITVTIVVEQVGNSDN